MKGLLENLMLLAAIAAAAYGLYYYFNTQPDDIKPVARYSETGQETMFHEVEDVERSRDDCERHVNPEVQQSCLDNFEKQQ